MKQKIVAAVSLIISVSFVVWLVRYLHKDNEAPVIVTGDITPPSQIKAAIDSPKDEITIVFDKGETYEPSTLTVQAKKPAHLAIKNVSPKSEVNLLIVRKKSEESVFDEAQKAGPEKGFAPRANANVLGFLSAVNPHASIQSTITIDEPGIYSMICTVSRECFENTRGEIKVLTP